MRETSARIIFRDSGDYDHTFVVYIPSGGEARRLDGRSVSQTLFSERRMGWSDLRTPEAAGRRFLETFPGEAVEERWEPINPDLEYSVSVNSRGGWSQGRTSERF